MNKVHAPYHFVPLSQWVYMPDWAHQVSHDVPFETGLSGKISYTLTNTTELIVGGIQQDRSAERKPTLVNWAKDPDGQPVIPGSSIKGMLRNVLEIATFGKFSPVEDSHFSYRDISNATTKYQTELQNSDCYAYWLKFDNRTSQWTLRKAKHSVLFHDEFNQFSDRNILNIAFKQPAQEKYKQWPLSNNAIAFSLADRRIEGTKGKMVNVERATTLGQGPYQGYPVFSGFRPGLKRHITKRLNFSYIFYDAEASTKPFEQGEERIRKLFANHDETLVSYLKKHQHPAYGIPIFVRQEKQSGNILALGFAKMPRKLYPQSVAQTTNNVQKTAAIEHYYDLAELIFGSLREKGLSLKSRVCFSDAVCLGKPKLNLSEPVILGQPKASYLNAYLEQPDAKDDVLVVSKQGDLAQYNPSGRVAGWKRYPAKAGFTPHLPDDVKEKYKVQSQLELLPPNNQFQGELIFHNLKPEELGALLWAIKLGQAADENHYFHGLGHGKSLGAGAIQIKVTALVGSKNADGGSIASDPQIWIDPFIAHMNEVYPRSDTTWQQSPQLTHLLAFSQRADNIDPNNKDLSYMPLTNKDPYAEEVTYTSSVKGREKLVLPPWRNKGKPLNRQENIKPSEHIIASFGQGRLAPEADEEKQWPQPAKDELAKTRDANNQQCEDKLAEQERAAFEKLTPVEQRFDKLSKQLAPHIASETPAALDARRNCNKDIDEILDLCLTTPVKGSFIQSFYQLCNDTQQSAYLVLANNKKNKVKLKERKDKLAALAEKYGLET